MKISNFLVMTFLCSFNYICAMQEECTAPSSIERFVYSRKKGYITQSSIDELLQKAKRQKERKRGFFIKQLVIKKSLKEEIKKLPTDMHNLIAQSLVSNKQVWYEKKDLCFKYAWGSFADLTEERAKIFLSPSGSHLWALFYNRPTNESLKLNNNFKINSKTALWNMTKTKLLTLDVRGTICLWDVFSGKELARIQPDDIVNAVFFMHDEGSALAADGAEDDMKIIAYEKQSTKSYKFMAYNFTLGQALLYKLLYAWLLVEKPHKRLVKAVEWNAAATDDLLVPYINHIATALGICSRSNVLLKTWKTIPDPVRKNIWSDIRLLIVRYGK